jgi:hypothetical protein
MPVIGPETTAILREFVDHPEPPLAEPEWIEKQIIALSIKPSRKATATDSKMILATFVTVLKDYSRVDLGYAFGRLMRENKWFPDVSEIIELAEYPRKMRKFKKGQAKMLILKHEREWRRPIPDEERVKPEELAALVSELKIGAEGNEGDKS